MVEEIDHHERPPRRSYLAPPKTPYGLSGFRMDVFSWKKRQSK